MMHDPEFNYIDIKSGLLDAYYDYCRDRGVARRNGYDDLLGRMEEDFEQALESDVENFMLYVVELVLSAGLNIGFEQRLRERVVDFWNSESNRGKIFYA